MRNYCISDLHFFHDNIIRYCNRPFKTTQEMNDTIINNINEVVQEDDILWCLGDWMKMPYPTCEVNPIRWSIALAKTRYTIRCKNIMFAFGNHDKEIRKYKEFQYLFTECKDYYIRKLYNKFILMLHRTDRMCDKEVIFKFNNMFKNGIVLHGHVHNNSDLTWQNMCVEVNDYKPVDLESLVNNH